MEMLVNALQEFVQAHGVDRTYWIAYSGGLDSHVLLHLLANMRFLKLRAVYINHGIHPKATEWALHCEQVCRELNVNFIQQRIEAHDNKLTSPEDQLRQLRYQKLAELISSNEILLTAHHQNDQAETILLQLLRGAGPKGLAAMPKIKPFAKGLHARPLLNFTRAHLMHYAKEHKLQWIEDDSNINTQFTRNFLRQEIMPILTKRFPTVTKMLARSADHCAKTQEFVEETVEQMLTCVRGTFPQTLSIKKLLQLDEAKQKHVLRSWILQANFSLPSQIKMRHILNDMLHARDDKMPHVTWGDAELRRYRDDLFMLPISSEHNATQKIEWNLHESLKVPGVGELRATLKKGQGIRAIFESVTVQFRQGGEVIRLPGRKHHHDLKKLFQLWDVPAWQRDKVPLIYVDDELVAVVGFCVTEHRVAKAEEWGWELCLA